MAVCDGEERFILSLIPALLPGSTGVLGDGTMTWKRMNGFGMWEWVGYTLSWEFRR